MNVSANLEITVSEPLPNAAVDGGLKPLGRQRHNEDAGGTDRDADHHHSIRGKLLGQRANDWHQTNDNDRIDR